MSRLIIIGNGFDLYHELPTSYKDDLVPILKKNNKELFEKLNKLYFKNDIKLWSEFENRIGATEDIDYLNEPVRQDLWHLYDIEVPYFPPESKHFGNFWLEYETAKNDALTNRVDLETVFSDHHSDLEETRGYLEDGLIQMCKNANNLNNKKNNLEKIFRFCENDYFLTFNYTNTLEKVYGKLSESSICHIHGSIDDGGNLVFGNSSENIIESNSELYEENPNYSKKPYTDCEYQNKQEFEDAVTYSDEDFEMYNNNVNKIMDKLNESMVKPISIEKLKVFLSGLEIKQIFIFGLSMGEVDLPYFEEIHDFFPKAEWFISVYNTDYIIKKNIRGSKFENKIKYLKIEEFIDKLKKDV